MNNFKRWLKRNDIPFEEKTAYVCDWYTKDGLHRPSLAVDAIRIHIYDGSATWYDVERIEKYGRKHDIEMLFSFYNTAYGSYRMYATCEDAEKYNSYQELSAKELDEYWQDRHEKY